MPSLIRWLVLAILSSALFLIVIDVTVLYLALPSLTHDLHASASEKLWILNAYTLTVAGLLPGMGTLGDRFGYKRLFLSGLCIFGLASLAAAFSPNPEALIAARVALAVGAATMMPATLALIRHVFEDEHERSVAIGIWAAIATGGAALGPVMGGILLEHFWWGSVFLINVPIALVALLAASLWIPGDKKRAGQPFDLISALQIMVTLTSLTLAIKEVTKPTPSWALAIGATAVCVLGGLIFYRRQQRAAVPMITFDLFHNRAFSAGLLTASTASAALMGVELVISQRFQLVSDMSPLQAGLAIVPIPLAALVAGPLTGFFLRRVGAMRMLWLALVVSATGLLIYLAGYQAGDALRIGAFVITGLGIGAAVTAASSTMLLNAPADRAGMAASIEEVSYELGGLLGIAILGSLMTAVYSANFVAPDGMAVLQAGRDSIDEALRAAETLPGALANRVIQEAHDAFDQAFVTVLRVAALMLAAAAAGVALLGPRPWLTKADRPLP